MSKQAWLVLGVLVAAVGCGEVKNSNNDASLQSCIKSCTSDADCTGGQTCGDQGLCISAGATCPCTASEFLSCSGDTARFCNDTGDGVRTETCGAGCNEASKKCNDCVANGATCSSDHTKLNHCDAEGTLASSDACGAGCITTATGDACGHVQPMWLPNVCDTAATTPSASLTGGTIDTSQDAMCTGGVLTVNGQTFCVIRAGTIDIGTLKVIGNKAIAFVADDALNVTGILDVSADGTNMGPGGGYLGQGASSVNGSYQGAGGSGFAQTGGAGGPNESNAGALPGGSVTQRLTTAQFIGGAQGGNSICGNGINSLCISAIDFSGGGGGGGALLIACRGKVTVASTATIDAGGGGGAGGGDHYNQSTSLKQGGGGGGGTGGYVVFQGGQVELLGKFYANGGGGGGACGTDNCRGPAGADGGRVTTGAPGGDTAGNTCGGGIGGSVSNNPGAGELTFSAAAAGAGGGGGAIGKFEVFTPAGVSPTITPAQASPNATASAMPLMIR
jgi:hypothetical protein